MGQPKKRRPAAKGTQRGSTYTLAGVSDFGDQPPCILMKQSTASAKGSMPVL
jgi:hypothetical protein